MKWFRFIERKANSKKEWSQEAGKPLEKKILEHSSLLQVRASRSKEAIWDNIIATIPTGNEPAKSRHKLNKLLVTAVAAAAAIVVLYLVFLPHSNENRVIVKAGQKESLVLPDGSEVKINSGSHFSFDEHGWLANRESHLKGEAFFSVNRGNQFTVKCPNGMVKVLGTSFNVFCRKNRMEVKCMEGKVAVTINGRDYQLAQNNGIVYNSDTKKIKSYSMKPSDATLWVNGQSSFKNANLQEVFEEVERQFDVKIKYEGQHERYFTGYFENENLLNALEMVCKPMGLNYVVEDASGIIRIN